MGSSDLKQTLLAAFDALEGRPAWACEDTPGVPSIGSSFIPGESLLIYGALQRAAWDAGRLRSESFYPENGLEELRQGGVLCAALLASEHLQLPVEEEAVPYLDRIAVAPWCKFSLRDDQLEVEEVGERELFTHSLPFVARELEILRPGAVLLPKAIWGHRSLRVEMLRVAPRTRFIPVPTFQTLVLRQLSNRHALRARRLEVDHAGAVLGRWVRELTHVQPSDAWGYLAEVEEVLELGGDS